MNTREHVHMLEIVKALRVVFGSQKRHYASTEKTSGVGGAQMHALSEIRRSPGITVGELARRLAVHRSTATNLVNRLSALNLVIKRREGDDQRKVMLETTARGAALCGKRPKPVLTVLQRALMDMPPNTLRTLNSELAALVAAVRQKDAKARRASFG